MNLTFVQEIKTKGDYDYDATTKVEKIENNFTKEYLKNVLIELKDTFIKHKIKFIIGDFSGGHDDGGFDSVYFTNEKEEPIEISPEDKKDFKFFVDRKNIYKHDNKKEKKILVFYTLSNDSKNLVDELDDMLLYTGALDEYGSFAGEYHVQGTVKLDVFDFTCKRQSDETIETYNENNEEFVL